MTETPVYIIVGAPKVYDQSGQPLETTVRITHDKAGESLFISVHVPETKPETKIQSFMPGVTLTKPSIRVPVWGQEFVVQNPRLVNGQICVDVTPPLIRDQFGHTLSVTAWANDVITVKAPEYKQTPEQKLDKDRLERIAKLEADTEAMRRDMDLWREKYREEHERANKLQDSEALAKRKLTECESSDLAKENKELMSRVEVYIKNMGDLRTKLFESEQKNSRLEQERSILNNLVKDLQARINLMEQRAQTVQKWLSGKSSTES